MNTDTTNTVEEISLEEAAKLEKFKTQENRFTEVEESLAICRAFWEKHKEALVRFSYYGFYGWDCKFTIHTYGTTAKEIARAFGAEGWERKFDTSICGRVNWIKKVDGMEITIEGAEMIKPTLNEKVKL